MGSANQFGQRFSITTFGESHGPALGVLIDGCPAGIPFDEALLKNRLARRRPGSSALVTSRNEADEPEVLSGIYEGRTLGTPIAVIVRNTDARSGDYQGLAPRAGHADDVWKMKFGHSDPRGGGRSSGRETLARVIGGAFAEMFLRAVEPKLSIVGFATAIGPLALGEADERGIDAASGARVDASPARFPSAAQAAAVTQLLTSAKADGKSYGGIACVRAWGIPAGVGQPVFHKLKADLASAYLGVGATAAVEIGEGADSAGAEGSEFHRRGESPYGGIRGGIATGEPFEARVTFKPTSSVMDVAKKGRHDPCIVPRAIPVLEAMTWLVLADHWLWARGDRIDR